MLSTGLSDCAALCYFVSPVTATLLVENMQYSHSDTILISYQILWIKFGYFDQLTHEMNLGCTKKERKK